jgi:glycosyl transferase family 11
MIIVRCMGGLGNQMFQYALGRCLAIRHRETLRLDLSLYQGRPLRSFELDHYAVKYRKATLCDLGRFVNLGSRVRILSAPWRLLDRGRCRVVHERFFHFDPTVLESGNHVLLEGYWQSASYFESIASDLRKELTPTAALEEAEAALAARIAAANAVAIHVRGGDYLSDPAANRTLGACPPEYYRAALAHVRDRIQNPTVFVFSDDPARARSVIPVDAGITFVEGGMESRAWVDQHLMSRCRHQVIANSTFSWWAAWLNPFAGKIVVAPREWFRNGASDTRDLFPPNWVTL